MTDIKIDISHVLGKIKPMHGVNNGPIVNSNGAQGRGNDNFFREAGIPYCRTHDSTFYSSYGGEHTIDVDSIFPVYNADVDSPDSYDFAMTDKYISDILKGGSKVFYRLGSTIEHGVKKYHTFPHQDFLTWAKICEHIIMHYNCGWANGFNYGIEYWEIWNEPDGWEDLESAKRPTWAGTREQFFEFYCTTATYLKSKFPSLKIGGPAHGFNMEWAKQFLQKIKETNSPIDFFSWHIYSDKLQTFKAHAIEMHDLFMAEGFENIESICSEWNCIGDFSADKYIQSLIDVHSIKGACYSMGSMIIMQDLPVDMLLYYDARPCAYNGLFHELSLHPITGYYPFLYWNELYKLGNQVKVIKENDDVYVSSAVNHDGTACTVICYYPQGSDKSEKITLEFPSGHNITEAFICDGKQNNQPLETEKGNKISLELNEYDIVFIKSKND